MKKRIISMLLLLAMLIGIVPAFGITTNAAKQTHYCDEVGTICGEIPYAYRAMKTTYPEDFFITWINMFESYDGSTRDYPYDAEKFNEKIKDSLSSELASHLDPDKINAALFVNCAAGTGSFADAGTAEYDLYDALFLSMLLENASNSEVQDSVFEFINEIISALNTVQEYIINGTTVTSKFIDLIPEIKGTGPSTKIPTLLKQVKGFNKISASFDEFFGTCKELDLNSGFDVFVKLIEVLVEVADETTEVVAAIEDCILIYRNVGPTYAAVLERIYNNTEDFTIKQIATKYYTLIKSDSWFEVIALSAIEVVNGAVEAGAGVGEIVLKTLIGTTKYGPQYAAVVAALAALDAIIGTKAEIEAAYALICMQKMDEAMANTLKELDSEFKANFNAGKDDLASYCANEYVTAAIMCLRMLQKEYDYCQKFFDAVYDNGLVNKLMNCFPTANKAKFDGWTSHVKTQKEFLKNISEGIFEEGSSLRKQYHSHISLIEKGMKVTYDLNGGSNIEDFAPQTKAYNLHMITRSGTPTKEGYVFTGWRPTINGNYINPVDFWYYKNENAISPNINPCYYADKIVLTAQWTGIQNTITYNANGGTGAPASHENTVGSTTLSTTVPTRNGHTFLGWSESATATTATYQPGAVLTKEGNITLYAIWQPKTFNIIFDANGGVFTAYDNATTVTRPKVYAQNFTFDVTYPVRDGYKCIGWSLENDNTVDWTNGETENDIGAANANDKRVYAVWVDTTVDVTYDYNDGSGKTDMVSVDIQNSNTHTIQEPINAKESLKNYFKGWMYQDPNGKHWWASDNNDLGKVTVVQPGNQLLLSNDITLYAKWDYYVHYNDGTAFTHDVVRAGNGYVIDAPLHTPSGKEFKSWKGEDANGNVAYYKAGDTINLTTDWTLTATWSDGSTVESYVTVSYDANGGRGSIADDEVIAGGKVTLDDGDSLYRYGYEFVGWAEQPNAVSRDYRGGVRITVDENITLYAVWKAVSDETIATVTMSADKEIYEPGDTIIITVLANNTDHFYIDADSAKFNVLRQDGSTIHTGGVFVEKNAPTLMFPNNRYRNGREYEVELYIPKNCSDGTYTISIKATDSVLNEHGDGNVDGQAAKIAKYSINIVVEDGYKDKVTVNVNKSKVTLHIDDVDTLKATITPSSAKRYLEWYSSNENIVTVTEKSNQKGRIVATGYGTATITADVNGVKDTCTVVVERCTYDQKEIDTEFLKTPATCSSYAVYYKSCECGYHGSSTFTYSEGGYAQHSYINHKCACGEIEYMSVTFMNGESQWHKIEAQYNSSLNLAQMTSPEATKGYVFAGWYTENGTRIAEGFTVAENIIAHAKFVAGDADGNGRIEKSDSNMIIRYILGEKNGVVDDKNALDINKDGKVTIVDAIKVLLYLSSKTDALD